MILQKYHIFVNNMFPEEKCPVCLDEIAEENQFTTSCGHVFCSQCIYQIHTLCIQVHCPLCRRRITNISDITEKKVKLDIAEYDPSNYPISPTFEFIQCTNSRDLFSNAYYTIERLEAWQTLHNYVVDDTTGFMFPSSDEIKEIIQEIANDYGNHSGCTMAVTMRVMHFISQFGWTTFRERIQMN